jgi:iron complex outermembrane recepter protein
MRLPHLIPLSLLAGSALVAQQRPDTAATRTLPVVTVTATRSATPIALAPYAVTQIDTARLRAVAGVGLADALQGIPGVLAQSRAGGVDTRITIRGFGARGAGDRSNAATVRGIRIMIDGIPETEPDGRTSLDLVDLSTVSSVDVVRSNASALWGNAAGGVISLSSTPPLGAALDVRTMVGSFGLRRALLNVSSGGDAVRAYAMLSRTDADGWRQNSLGDRTLLSAGVLVPIGARDLLAVRFSASQNRFNIPGPLTLLDALVSPRNANATYLARRERRENTVLRLGTTFDHSVGTDGVLSVMSYVTPKLQLRSERNTYREFNRVHGGGSVTFREKFGAHRVVVGADVQHQDGPAQFFSLSSSGGKGTALQQDKSERATTAGVFVQDEWAAATRISLTIGARLDGLRYGVINRVAPKLSDSRKFSQLSPKIGATFRIADNHLLYANVGAGVEAPAGNETDPASTFGQDTVVGINPLLQPIRSQTYELGLRRAITFTNPSVQSARYELAFFHTDVRNELVPYRGGRFYFSASRARRQGAELSGAVSFAGGVSLRGTSTLMRTEYLNYTVDSVHYGKPGAVASYSGNAMVGVPRAMGSAGIAWDVMRSPVRVDAEAQHTGSYVLNDANSLTLPAATLLNASLVLRQPSRLFGRVGLTGFVRVENLLDKRFLGSGFLNPDVVAGQAVAYEPGMPRSFTVSLGLVRLR